MALRTIIAAVAVSAIATVAQAATFNIDLNLDGTVNQYGTDTGATSVSVSGFIETNVDSGSLDQSNVTDWLITISDGFTTQTSRKGDAGARFEGANNFTISGDELLTTSFFFGTWANTAGVKSSTALRYRADTNNIIAYATSGATYAAPTAGVRGFSGPVDSPALIGEQLRFAQLQVVDAPPVPLPATALLLLAGLGIYGGLRRKA